MELQEKQQGKRLRWVYGLLVILWMGLGFYSRTSLPMLSLVRSFGGDVLWAGMVYFLLAFCFPNKKIHTLIWITLGFSYIIECSQLWDVSWLVYARSTPLRYVLGQGFVWSDLVCYTIGTCLSGGVDWLFVHRRTRR